jgi:hypothetical protein
MNFIFTKSDIWYEIFKYIDMDIIIQKKFYMICKDAYTIFKNPMMWYNQCKWKCLGFEKDEDFEKNRPLFDWFEEYKSYTEDRFLRIKAKKLVLKENKNIFITGGAGVGKTHLLLEIVKELQLKNEKFAITSSTGSSAFNIGGQTIHSWSGLRIAKDDIEDIISNFLYNSNPFTKRVTRIWKNTKILIVDEISMLVPEYLNKLDLFGRAIRNESLKAFGGIQLIFIGDFCQLSPILDKDKKHDYNYCFQLPNWKDMIKEENIIYLKYSHRQKSDAKFFGILNRIRLGCHNENDVKILSSKVIKNNTDYSEMTLICPKNKKVEEANQKKLDTLNTEQHSYIATFNYFGFGNQNKQDSILKILKDKCPVPSPCILKLNCKVMLVVNLDISKGLVNGAIGTIVGFDNRNFPTVQFKLVKVTLIPHVWNFEDRINSELATYSHMPLALAYAFTIHKTQGMTFYSSKDNESKQGVIIDIGKDAFAKGQIYVAISRFTSLDGWNILNFNPSSIKVDTEVIKFYRNLENKNSSNPLPFKFPDLEEMKNLVAEYRIKMESQSTKRSKIEIIQ